MSNRRSPGLSDVRGSEKWLGIEMAEIKHVLNIFQGLASAVHNVDRGHSPVFIFAGAAPQSSDSRLKGTKNEWPMWLQGAVSFYCLGTWHTLNLPQMSRTSRQSSVSTCATPRTFKARRTQGPW